MHCVTALVCARACRAMEFCLAILQSTHDHPQEDMAKIVTDVYTKTLYQFHGFMASSAFYVSTRASGAAQHGSARPSCSAYCSGWSCEVGSMMMTIHVTVMGSPTSINDLKQMCCQVGWLLNAAHSATCTARMLRCTCSFVGAPVVRIDFICKWCRTPLR